MKTATETAKTVTPMRVKDLEPRNEQDARAGLSLNYTKIEYKYMPQTDR